jgi:uncharacterized protein
VFEWDENKRAANWAKHRIDFDRAARTFQNPVLERIDDREDHGEERFIATGFWKADFAVVVTTWRGGVKIGDGASQTASQFSAIGGRSMLSYSPVSRLSSPPQNAAPR